MYRCSSFSYLDINYIWSRAALTSDSHRRIPRRILNSTAAELRYRAQAVQFTLGLGRRQCPRTPIPQSCIPITSVGRVKFFWRLIGRKEPAIVWKHYERRAGTRFTRVMYCFTAQLRTRTSQEIARISLSAVNKQIRA